MKQLFTFILLMVMTPWCQAQIITTVAGGGTAGIGNGGPAADCELNNPIGIAVDAAGNIYIGDRNNHRIRKINTAGIITTIAGTGTAGFSGDGGPATDANINSPYGLCVDNSGNVYFTDNGNDRVRKISNSGTISTIAGGGSGGLGDGGPATNAVLYGPAGVVTDNFGNIYISDGANLRVRKVDALGVITTIAGGGSTLGDGGPATAAKMNLPYAITKDSSGNIYVTEDYGARVRKINSSGIISTIAGTGTSGYSGDGGSATNAKVNRPTGIAIDKIGNIYISDAQNNRIRKINTEGIITTIAGTGIAGYYGDGGNATDAQLKSPVGVAVSISGSLYISDFGNNRIRTISNIVSLPFYPKLDLYDFNLYPNPSNGKFIISCSSKLEEPYDVVVTDMLGKEVYQAKGVRGNEINIEIQLPNGIYFANIQYTDRASIIKIVQIIN